MAIIPKDLFKTHPFVDRKVCLQNFKDAVYNIRLKEFSVLVYYGVAGIGKTSLRKEFIKYLEAYNNKNKKQDVTLSSILQREIIWTSIDLQLDKHREKSTFLVTLKNDLQEKFKIDFPAFEIAHAVYWKKANPEIPLRKDNYLLFEGNNTSDDIFGIIGQISPLGIVHNAGRLVLKNLPDHLRKWWTKRGEEELKKLPEKEPLEIEKLLPYFWSEDLNNHLKNSSKIAVLFIDTYEVLRENYSDDGYSLDEWIREELITRLSKNVLWVICGREALRWKEVDNEWSKYLTQYKVEELLRNYCVEYLESRGITDKEIQEAIFSGSKGVPYYLELSADIYERIIKTSEKPKPEDFGNNHQAIVKKFFRYLSPEEKNSLNVLSIPRFWDYDLFKYLVKEFNTGYSTNNYKDLCSFSFIGKAENNKQQMHQLMQECLYRTQGQKDPDSLKRIHKAISEYYIKKIENIDIKAITFEHESALTEAFYHAKESMEAEDLLNWFIDASNPLKMAAFWQYIISMYEEILQILEAKLGHEHPNIATTLNELSQLYHNMGEYKEALSLYNRAIKIREKTLGTEHYEMSVLFNNLALLYRDMGEYKEALSLYNRAIKIREKTPDTEYHDMAVLFNNLAMLYCDIGEYEKALPFYNRAIRIIEKALGKEHYDLTGPLSNLSGYYKTMGKNKKALALCNRALKITENTLGKEHPEVAVLLNNLGSIYYDLGKYERALSLYNRSIKITEKALGPEHLDITAPLNNLGGLYVKIGEYEKALSLYNRALNIKEKTLGPEHPDVSISLGNLASVYHSMGKYEKACSLHKRTIDIIENSLGPEHPDIAIPLANFGNYYTAIKEYEKALFLYNRALCIIEKTHGSEHQDLAVVLDYLANFYDNIGEYEKALSFYNRALSIKEKTLGLEHPDVGMTLWHIANHYCQLKRYEEALPICERSFDIIISKLGPDYPFLETLAETRRYLFLKTLFKDVLPDFDS
jgi:tetratricopeptide (TPR) repeat protein